MKKRTRDSHVTWIHKRSEVKMITFQTKLKGLRRYVRYGLVTCFMNVKQLQRYVRQNPLNLNVI